MARQLTPCDGATGATVPEAWPEACNMVGPWTSMNFRPNFASDWTSFQNGEPMGTPIGKFHMIIMIMECDYIILHPYQAAADAEPKPMGSASPTAAEKAPGQRRPRFFFSREPKNQWIQYQTTIFTIWLFNIAMENPL
jgi:hypothetical protein